jgi:tubulin polyglutamylase TTLL6/13
VKHVASKTLGWKLSNDEEDEKWDILWTDTAVPPERLSKMHPYQKINHFPGMYSISRKNYLAMNLSKLKKKFPEDYNFFPKSWLFPCDQSELRTFLQLNKSSYLIVKPEASCQGRGIFLTKKLENIDTNGRFVVQEYLKKPYLIENLKFDLRIYVLVAGCDPLRIFVHEEGLTRFATEEYCRPSASNSDDMCMHLTNYAVNKNNPNFVHCEDSDDDSGHKRSLQSTYDCLKAEGFDVDLLKATIDDAIIKTLCSIQPTLAHHYRSCQPEDLTNGMCFEVLGFDVILDNKARPYVLEVNHTPSFTTDSPLDWKIKKKVIRDALVLMNVTARARKQFLVKQKEMVMKRALTGRLERETKEERNLKIALAKEKRDKWESKHFQGFRKVFPLDNEEKYQKFLDFALEAYQEWTGGPKNKKVQLEKDSKHVKTLKDIRKAGKKVVELKGNRCSSIPNLTSPVESEKPNSTVFERLSRPQIKKYKSSKAPVFPPLVYFDEFKVKNNQRGLMQSSRVVNPMIEARKMLTVNNGFKGLKLFEFPIDKTFDC